MGVMETRCKACNRLYPMERKNCPFCGEDNPYKTGKGNKQVPVYDHLPNKLPEGKAEYMRKLLSGRASLLNPDYVITMYHLEIPIEQAKVYLDTLEQKLINRLRSGS